MKKIWYIVIDISLKIYNKLKDLFWFILVSLSQLQGHLLLILVCYFIEDKKSLWSSFRWFIWLWYILVIYTLIVEDSISWDFLYFLTNHLCNIRSRLNLVISHYLKSLDRHKIMVAALILYTFSKKRLNLCFKSANSYFILSFFSIMYCQKISKNNTLIIDFIYPSKQIINLLNKWKSSICHIISISNILAIILI